MGKDGVILEYHADIPLVGLHVIDYLVIKADLPAIHRIEACDHTQQSRLTTSGWAKQCEKFSRLHLQIHPI